MSARKHAVHLAGDGRARCGHHGAQLFGDRDEVTCTRCLRAPEPVVHLERDGRARCGNQGAALFGGQERVTCKACLNLLAGTHHAGVHWADPKPHGTVAAYKRHHRHGETPCEPCKQAEARRQQDRRASYGRAA